MILRVPTRESDRKDEKDDFNGTEGTLRTDSVDTNQLGEPVFHPSDLSKIPGCIIERKSVQVFSLKTCLVKERFEMVYYAAPGQKPKWSYYPSEGHPEVVIKLEGTKGTLKFLQAIAYEVYVKGSRVGFAKAIEQGSDSQGLMFSDDLERLLSLERQYDAEKLSLEERDRRRQGLETKESLIRLRSNLQVELPKDASERSCYLSEALNSLDKLWREAFVYIKDGNYPIDNNLAERTLRKLTTQRNSMLHFSSDEGAEMTAIYHRVISTVKLQGRSAWELLGKFFPKIFKGSRDFSNLTPPKYRLVGMPIVNTII